MESSRLAEEWNREVEEFPKAVAKMLHRLVSQNRISISEDFFLEIYSDLGSRVAESRGWWNPLLSPYTVYHFYDQAVIILNPARSASEFKHLHGISPREVVRLVDEGLLIVMLSAPHTEYGCECFEEILEAQGVLPTIFRVTEPLKAIFSRIDEESSHIYNTKELYSILKRQLGLEDLDARDAATRIGDLALLGYKRLARRLLDESRLASSSRELLALVRAFHHILVEPVIDSGATIGTYSPSDIEFIERISSAGVETARLVAETLWSIGAKAKIRVPRQYDLKRLQKFLAREDTIRAHKEILEYRKRLRRLSDENVEEASEIAKQAAGQMEKANKILQETAISQRELIALGFIAQMPVDLIIPSSIEGGVVQKLLLSATSVALSMAAEGFARKLAERLLTVEEHVMIVPVTPMIFEVERTA